MLPRFRTLVRGGLVLVSAGAGAAAISAYQNAKRPDASQQHAGMFLLDEVKMHVTLTKGRDEQHS